MISFLIPFPALYLCSKFVQGTWCLCKCGDSACTQYSRCGYGLL